MAKKKVGKIPVKSIASIIVILAAVSFLGIRPSSLGSLKEITLPDGFSIEVFAEGLSASPTAYPGPNTGPRMMEFIDGVLFASIPSQGKVVALPDDNNDFKADRVVTVIDKLGNPHGLEFHDGWLYIAEEERVIRVKLKDNLEADSSTLEVLVGHIPNERLPHGGHFTRTIKIFNNSLYLSAGSGCNVCYEQDERRAAVTKCDLDGKNCKTFAKGIRNAVGFVFHPITGEMYATENGRDLLGDDLPPDEINIIKEGKDYGWPICYGKNIHDTDFDKNVYIRDPCADKEPSLIDLQAHSAPLGLAFYYGNNFPEGYKGDLFVAYHGSWNRGEPTGYKIVRIKVGEKKVEDFATGWLTGTTVTGRPVGIIIASDGSMFVSDDNAGKIYRISYIG
ncbi:MAG: PQQ-dependent sugar dehydrogenase [Candidatus Aenigmarchaeota archaeon]|nr:PQQ-dependent sugar dehydrogenase [Candidatus Aenigmarchaeota archaeon]